MSETSNSKPINGRGLKKLWALIDRHKQDKLKAGDITTELLANKSITASKIANKAIGYEAIDWETMPFKRVRFGDATIPAAAASNQWSFIEIPAPGFGDNVVGIANTSSTNVSPAVVSFISTASKPDHVAFGIFGSTKAHYIKYILIE